MPTFQPFRNYADTYHVLGAGACYVHPNGNVYFYACEKVDGQHQNLVIYRHVAATGAWETVVTFEDGVVSQGFIERGGCVITPDGSMWVATSLQPKGALVDDKHTGFQGVWCRIPNTDAPYTNDTSPLAAHLADVEAVMHETQNATTRLGWRIDAIETALGTLSSGGLDADDRAALEWVKQVRALP